ncbi:MAG: C25 family cysteine peptidase, partial [Syntrophobacteria bacterium]
MPRNYKQCWLGILALAVILFGVGHAVGADYQTVGGSGATIVDAIAFLSSGTYQHAHWMAETCSFTEVGEDVIWECATDSFPVYSIQNALSRMGEGEDVAYWSSFGAPAEGAFVGGLMIEAYAYEEDRNTAYRRYVRTGTYEDDTEIFAGNDCGYFCIGVRPDFIEANSAYGARSIMMVGACHSDDWQDAWGAGAHVGYEDPVGYFWTLFAEADTVFSRLGGSRRRVARVSGAVDDGLECVMRGDECLVVNPAVKEIYPESGHVFATQYWAEGYVEFDTTIELEGAASEAIECDGFYDEYGAYNPIFQVGAISLVGDSRLEFLIQPKWRDTAPIHVRAGSIRGAGSQGRYLNGNTDPDGMNCWPPDQDDFDAVYTSLVGEEPAATIVGLRATASGGATVEWETESEKYADYFVVERWAGGSEFVPVSPPIPHQASAYHGASYAYVDSEGGLGDYYRLVEVETDGDHIVHEQVRAEYSAERPSLPPADGPRAQQQEDVAELLETPLALGRDGGRTGTEALVICPAEWTSLVEPLVQHWETTRSLASPMIASLESIGEDPSDQDIKNFIDSFDEQLAYVLLVGDANRRIPEQDVVPSHYVEYEGCYWDSVYCWDGWYGDIDEDGLPEIAVSRFLAETSGEVTAQVQKSLQYDSGFEDPWRRECLALVHDLDPWVYDLAHEIIDELPYPMNSTAIHWSDYPFPQYEFPYEAREAATLASWNAGVHLVVALGTVSDRVDLVRCLMKPQFDMSELTENGMCPVVLGNCCGLGDYTRGESTYGRELVGDFQTASNKGSLAWIGCTESSEQWTNYVMAQEFVRRIDMDGTLSLGEVWLAVQAATHDQYPQGLHEIRMWSLFGDPTIRMTWDDIPTACPDAADGGWKSALHAALPNPFSSDTTMRYAVATPGRVSVQVYDVAGRLVWTAAD